MEVGSGGDRVRPGHRLMVLGAGRWELYCLLLFMLKIKTVWIF